MKTHKTDGWSNVLTGLGQAQDPIRANQYLRAPMLARETLDSVFAGDGLGRRIVEMPAEEAVRPWITIDGDEGASVLDILEALGTRHCALDAYVWARLYGGSVIITLLDDGLDLDQPVNPRGIEAVIGHRVYDRHEVYRDPGVAANTMQRGIPVSRYYDPEYYSVSPVDGEPFRAHRSRLSILGGKRLPSRLRTANLGWDASVLQGVHDRLAAVGTTYGYAQNIMRDFVQGVLAVKGLGEMVEFREAEVKRRLELLDMSRSVVNMLLLDADGEQYTRISAQVGGLSDLLDRFNSSLAAAAGIPVTKLFGTSPGGLNATGDADIRNYYDALDADRQRVLGAALESIVRDIYRSRSGPTGGREPDAWSIRWNPLWQIDDTAAAALRLTIAQSDAIYLDRGVLAPEDVTAARFGADGWAMDAVVDDIDTAGYGPDPEPGTDIAEAP